MCSNMSNKPKIGNFQLNKANFSEQNRRMRDPEAKKHTLDSDEEDFVDESNVLHQDDIEGEEDGNDHQEEDGQKITAFNMNEEMEEGHFDKQGHFIWNNEKEIRDNWLDNIDWQRVKETGNKTTGNDLEDDDDDDSIEEKFDELEVYQNMLPFMKPKESVNKALKRLGGADIKLSSVERLKRKKAGILTKNEEVGQLTAYANQILTQLGHMDVYQETFESITAKLSKKKKLQDNSEIDMYSDDFISKEKQKIEQQSSDNNQTLQEIMWEFKWKQEDEKVEGPYTNAQMLKWSKEHHFKSGVLVRKCGEQSNFYNSNRIDFELY